MTPPLESSPPDADRPGTPLALAKKTILFLLAKATRPAQASNPGSRHAYHPWASLATVARVGEPSAQADRKRP